MEEAIANGVLYYKSRILWNDNSIHSMEAKGKVFYDPEKQPVKLIGPIRDITEEKNRDPELLESEQKLGKVPHIKIKSEIVQGNIIESNLLSAQKCIAILPFPTMVLVSTPSTKTAFLKCFNAFTAKKRIRERV